MGEFYGNPIKIMNKGVFSFFIELDIDFNVFDYCLIIESGKEILYKGEVDHNTFIEIDSFRYDEITLKYIDLKNKKTILEKKYRLKEKIKESEKIGEKNTDKEKLIEKIYEEVRDKMDNPSGSDADIDEHTRMLKNVTANTTARRYVERKIKNIVQQYIGRLNEEEAEKLIYEIYSNLYGMGVIQELDDSTTVGEILVNANIFPEFKCVIYYYENGLKKMFGKTFKNLYDLDAVFSRSIQFAGKELNQVQNAIVEATRSNGDRVTISIPGASPNNYSLNIRKFTNFTPNSESMKKSGTINDEIEKFLKILVIGKANIGIGGEMGTGKTTMINYLLTHTEPIERKVVIASVSEMDTERTLKGHDVIVYNVDESKGFTFDKLIKTSLRTTASRVIIPESRGEEFKQVYEANLKTRGNMFTAHALDDDSFIEMCVDMYNIDGSSQNTDSIRDKLSKSIDIVMVMKKVGNSIRIQSISEILIGDDGKYQGMNQFFVWDIDPEHPSDTTKGKYKKTNAKMSKRLRNRLNSNGIAMSEIQEY
jgi:pilus assembly protein CpaF